MSETRYPAWWAKLQEDMAAAGCFEEGARDRFRVFMAPPDYLELLEYTLDADRAAAEGAISSRIASIPLVVSREAIPGKPAVHERPGPL